jgi:hypothetical protein
MSRADAPFTEIPANPLACNVLLGESKVRSEINNIPESQVGPNLIAVSSQCDNSFVVNIAAAVRSKT